MEFRNIRKLPSGYQVSVTRKKKEFSKHFAGHSPKSLAAAQKYRDTLLRKVPAKRTQKIPPRIMSAMKIKQPIVGVYRHPRLYYAVNWRDNKGNIKTRSFSWRETKNELAAYRQAVAFRKQKLRR